VQAPLPPVHRECGQNPGGDSLRTSRYDNAGAGSEDLPPLSALSEGTYEIRYDAKSPTGDLRERINRRAVWLAALGYMIALMPLPLAAIGMRGRNRFGMMGIAGGPASPQPWSWGCGSRTAFAHLPTARRPRGWHWCSPPPG
jgi:hypothetical protein